VNGLTFSVKLMFMVIVVTLAWIIATLASKPVAKETLYAFYRQCHPGGPGWAKVLRDAKDEGVDLNGTEGIDWQMPLKLLCVFIGTVMVYSCLFSIGSFIYGNVGLGIGLGALSVACCYGIFTAFGKIRVG
jgi:SSS family solute:Na+ symporter